jgi:hypothetical protein
MNLHCQANQRRRNENLWFGVRRLRNFYLLPRNWTFSLKSQSIPDRCFTHPIILVLVLDFNLCWSEAGRLSGEKDEHDNEHQHD